MKRFIENGKSLLVKPQENILSAAIIIMIMIGASAVLGIVRERVLLYFFVPEDFSIFKAAFRFPDMFTGILALGALSSAFIPVFTKTYHQKQKEAWDVASRVVNIGLILFLILAAFFWIFSENIYSIVTPGYNPEEKRKVAEIARILFLSQGFFVVSYTLTGVLESAKRFFVTSVAPIFYNLGIVIGTILLTDKVGLFAPVIGVVIGAFLHLAIQFPLAWRLGFRFSSHIAPNKEVKKIGKLAAPRLFELAVLQMSNVCELFLSSFISTASYGYYTLAVSVQALPVSLFGLSLAKAALPSLASQSDNLKSFRATLFSTLYQVFFLVTPLSIFLIVLRIPIVRILFGTDIFDWSATVQTGLILSAFAIGIPFQAAIGVLARAFYALHETKVPVIVSLVSTALTIMLDFIFILILGLPTWAMAAAYSLGTIGEAIVLFYLLSIRLESNPLSKFIPIVKSIIAASFSGITMFFILKFFDRSVWIKRLSFFSDLKGIENLDFERFVLDTRFTVNLIALTAMTTLIGSLIYVLLSYFMKSSELVVLLRIIRRHKLEKPEDKQETLSPLTGDTSQV